MTSDGPTRTDRSQATPSPEELVATPSHTGTPRSEVLLPRPGLPQVRVPRLPRMRVTGSRVAPSTAPQDSYRQRSGPAHRAGYLPAHACAPAPLPVLLPYPVARTAVPGPGTGPAGATDSRRAESLLLVTIGLSGALICWLSQAPQACWLATAAPLLAAATVRSHPGADSHTARGARLAGTLVAALALGSGPAATTILALVWVLALAGLYPLLLPRLAVTLLASAGVLVLSVPVALRLLTTGQSQTLDLALLAVPVAATPVVAALSSAVAALAAAHETTTGDPATEDAPAHGTATGDADPWDVTEPQDSATPGSAPVTAATLDEALATPRPGEDPNPDGPTDPDTEAPWPLGPGTGASPAPGAAGTASAPDPLGTGTGAGPLPAPVPVAPTPPAPVPGAAGAGAGGRDGPGALVTTRELADRIELAASRTEVLGGSVALFLLELDGPAPTGPGTRRTVVDQMARRLRAALPAQDVVVRVEESTFALLVGGVDPAGCTATARRLSALVEEPVPTDSGTLSMSCTIGIALLDPQVRPPDDLVAAASRALRAVQRGGRARWALHDPALYAHTVSRGELEAGLRRAVAEAGIGVVFQPVVGLEPGEGVLRVEALARWRRPDGSTVLPQQFVPLADELGLGPALGRAVLEEALGAWTACRAAGQALPGLSVNVSPTQLDDPGFPTHLGSRLRAHGLDPASFTVELPASGYVDTEQAGTCVAMLHSLGVALSLDNFGRAGVSLAGVSNLPLRELKIDRSLTRDLGGDERLVRSAIGLARSLGIRSVVEGVETTTQLGGGVRLGADAAQGYLLSHPLPAADLAVGLAGAQRRVQGSANDPALP